MDVPPTKLVSSTLETQQQQGQLQEATYVELAAPRDYKFYWTFLEETNFFKGQVQRGIIVDLMSTTLESMIRMLSDTKPLFVHIYCVFLSEID